MTSYEEWKRKLKLKQFIIGWVNYYKLADIKKLVMNTDEWMRRRIRMVFWKKWKRGRTGYRNLRKLNIDHNVAYMAANRRKGYWYMANSLLQQKIGEGWICELLAILQICQCLNKGGAVYRTVRTVPWEVS